MTVGGMLRVLAAAALVGAAGCTTLGPDFIEPAPTWDADWTSPALAGVETAPAAGPWWESFNDPALNALVAAAAAANLNLREAGLRVLEARAALGIARAALSPQQTVATGAGGYGFSAVDGASVGDSDFLFGSVGVSTGWEIDFWGRFRRGIESADATYLASIASYQDLALILRAETAKLYFTHRTLEERLAVVRGNLALQRRSVEITELRFREGDQDELDYQQALTQLRATESSIPPLESALVQTRNSIALLLGRPPGPLPELALSPPRVPVRPPLLAADVPADYLRLRPDVRTAAFLAGAQSARIGIARADLYPSLSLVGSLAIDRTTLGSVTNTVELGIGPSLRWNFLDFGRIRGNIRVQDARFEQALTNYRQAVLSAAGEVDNAAIALSKGLEALATNEASAAAAQRSLDLAQLRYQEGLSDFQRVLDAQAALLRQQDQLVVARGDNARFLVDLHAALGGGLIPPAEGDFADAETRERMKQRTNWGGLLDPPAPSGDAPQ